jgi:hypothetical protein
VSQRLFDHLLRNDRGERERVAVYFVMKLGTGISVADSKRVGVDDLVGPVIDLVLVLVK